MVLFFTGADVLTLGQFEKLPIFFQHFVSHQTADPKLSLFDFVEMHYSDNEPDDGDDAEDRKLPFKQLNPDTLQLWIYNPSLTEMTLTSKIWPVVNPMYIHRFHPDPALSAAFKPPCA